MLIAKPSYILLSIFFLFAAACTKQNNALTPEAALQEYVNIGFHAKSLEDKTKLLALSTGQAQEELEKFSDQDFINQFVNSKLNLLSFKTKDLRKETNGDISLIYEISYENRGAGAAATLTNKKIAFLTLVGKSWKIKATTNLKSLVEKKEDLQVIPAGAPAPH